MMVMFPRLNAALSGERDMDFDNRQRFGASFLDKIARVTIAAKQRRAEAAMRKDRVSWKAAPKVFKEAEEEAPEGDWWAGDGQKQVDAPQDATPFENVPVEDLDPDDYEAWGADYDYDYDAWPTNEGGGPSDEYDAWPVNGGEDSAAVLSNQTIPMPSSAPLDGSGGSASSSKGRDKKAAASKGKAAASPWGESSSEEDNATPASSPTKGKGKGKAKGKASPKGKGSANKVSDPWADSDDGSEDASPGSKPSSSSVGRAAPTSSSAGRVALPKKGKGKGKSKGSAESDSDEAPSPARKPVAPRGASESSNSSSARPKPKSNPKRPKPKVKPVAKRPLLDDSSDESDADGGKKVMF